MLSRLCPLVLSIVCLSFVSAQDKPPIVRFEKEIKAFETNDAKSPPPKNAVLFIGASGIRMWNTLAEDFSQYSVINRGFGGSTIAEVTHYAERIVFPYEPKLIVLQSGGNDLNGGKSAEQVSDDFKAFVAKVRTKLPETPIVFMSIQPSPARWSQRESQQKANRLIAETIAGEKNLINLNAYDAFLNAEGGPREELFVADKLHHNAEGYKVRTALLTPVLDKLLPKK